MVVSRCRIKLIKCLIYILEYLEYTCLATNYSVTIFTTKFIFTGLTSWFTSRWEKEERRRGMGGEGGV